MIDPSKLAHGQRIELKQNDRGEWQEWIFDINNNIVDVETFKPFEESKKIKPNNYAELKKNYVYLSQIDEKPNDPLKLELPKIENIDPNLEEEKIKEDREKHDNEEEH